MRLPTNTITLALVAALLLALSALLSGETSDASNPAIDTDLDGCSDKAELGSDPATGGERDPASFWDFFDVWTHPVGSPSGWERN